jgi:hypothetical protein
VCVDASLHISLPILRASNGYKIERSVNFFFLIKNEKLMFCSDFF